MTQFTQSAAGSVDTGNAVDTSGTQLTQLTQLTQSTIVSTVPTGSTVPFPADALKIPFCVIQHDRHGTCPSTNFDSLSFWFLEKGLFFSRQDGCVIVRKRWLYFKNSTEVDNIRDRSGTSSGTPGVIHQV